MNLVLEKREKETMGGQGRNEIRRDALNLALQKRKGITIGGKSKGEIRSESTSAFVSQSFSP